MIRVVSPCAGWATPLDAVSDPVFAERMLGDGIAIDPIEGLVRAPVAGRIAGVHPAGHAVTIEAEGGATLLIHVGLETVALGGAGFEVKVAAGDRVAAGDPLIGFDLDAVGRGARSLVTPIVLTDGEQFVVEMVAREGLVAAGDPLFLLRRRAVSSRQPAVAAASVERAIVIPLRHGLHARPAARLAACAKGFDAGVELVAADGRSAALSSPVGLLALALPHGARVVVRASGPDAAAAIEAVAALIESGMGEGAPVAVAMEAPPVPVPAMLHGVTASPGIVAGSAWSPPAAARVVAERAEDPTAERRALASAWVRVRGDLEPLAEGEDVAAGIARAHLGFLEDSALHAAADRAIGDGASAGAAWRDAIAGCVAQLNGAGDRRFAERTADLRDLGDRVLAALLGDAMTPDPPPGAILVAVEVLPSQLMALAGKGLVGIASGGGGATSHAAIIAAGQALPMLAALGPDVARIAPGTPLLLDADAGTLAIDPPEALIAARLAVAGHAIAFRAAAQPLAHEPAVTRDGQRIEVFANLGSLADAEAAIAAGAEGCGLLRTEFAFLDRADPPGEDEQAALYQAIAETLGGRPLIVRTLDIGADKPAPWLPLAAEENPALGFRGVRIGLARPDLLRGQLRALLRVEGDVRIMLPMVVEPAELAAVAGMLAEEAATIGRAAPPLGVMIETPAAALLAGALARHAAFLSIGSNDLSQYALAMDRGNPAVAGRIDALHPAVLRLIASAAKGGAEHGRWTGVCGGLAADPAAVPLLIGLGVTELSVPPAAIAVAKAHVRAADAGACRALAERALDCADAAEVRALVRDGAA